MSGSAQVVVSRPDVDDDGGHIELDLYRVRRAWMDGLMPEAPLAVWEWADSYRMLTTRGANEAGRWRTSRTPYLREIMEALSPRHPAQRVVFMKGAQLGATEIGCNWLGYMIHHAPGPMLVVQPTLDLAKRFSIQRIDPMIASTEPLRERVSPARSKDAGNRQLLKQFPGGVIILAGANAPAGLRSMPVRYLFLDEIDAYPQSVGEEGDPLLVAEARTRTFAWRRKIFMASTPTIRGLSRIEREYEASDKRRYYVPCPRCGHMQALEFARLRWPEGRPEDARYACIECEHEIEERHKTEMLAAGEWRAEAVAEDRYTVGFWLSSLYSPLGWLSWGEIARQWDASGQRDDARKVVINTVLAETWTDVTDAPEWERLYERRGSYRSGTVPMGAVVLTAGVDVQKDRVEVSVWGWGRGMQSWLVEHIVVPSPPSEVETWAEVSRILARPWPHECGADVMIRRMAVDTGYCTTDVYAWSRTQHLVCAVKGVDGFDRSTPVSGPRVVEKTPQGKPAARGAAVWTVATATFKSELYRQLKLRVEQDGSYPPGYVHLPGDVDPDYCRQLVAEQLAEVRTRRGFRRLEWQKIRERNEALDCRVYARAAAWIHGLDRWGERHWARAEEALERAAEDAPSRTELPVPYGGRHERRVFLSSYL